MPAIDIQRPEQALRQAVQAVSDLSFSVEAGRVTGFLGPNGAGKSTTLRALLGLVHANAGTATFGGSRYEDLEHPSRQVGAVLEDASFHPGRTGRTTCACWPPPATTRPGGPTRCWRRSAWPTRATGG